MNDSIKNKKNKSVCFTPIPINAALKAADDWLGKDLPWFPVNEIQKEYLEKFFEKDSAEYEFVKRIASDKTEIIENFLAENGFPGMQVPEIKPPEFGIAGVMDQIVKWLREGKTTEMMGQDGNFYDAVDFDKGVNVLKSVNHPHPVAVLDTKSEDKVYLTFLDEINDDERQFGFQMSELSQLITDELKEIFSIELSSLRRQNIDYDIYRSYLIDFNHILIPKIDFEGDININWIVNMKTVDPWFISYGKMKAKLRLNHIGARAQAAVNLLAACNPLPPQILKFDRPFMIWFTHEGKVTFVMYVDYDCWKDPGDNIF